MLHARKNLGDVLDGLINGRKDLGACGCGHQGNGSREGAQVGVGVRATAGRRKGQSPVLRYGVDGAIAL